SIVLVGGRDGDDVLHLPAGRVVGADIVVRAVVPGRSHEELTPRAGLLDCRVHGVEDGLRDDVAGGLVAVVGDAGPVGCRVGGPVRGGERQDRQFSDIGTFCDFHRHDLNFPVDAHHPLVVVGQGAERARRLGAAGDDIHRVVVVVEEVPADQVVDVAVVAV